MSKDSLCALVYLKRIKLQIQIENWMKFSWNVFLQRKDSQGKPVELHTFL